MLHPQVDDYIVKDNCFKKDLITCFENHLLEYSVISHLSKFKFTEDYKHRHVLLISSILILLKTSLFVEY